MNHISKFLFISKAIGFFGSTTPIFSNSSTLKSNALKSIFIKQKYRFSTFSQIQSIFSKQTEPQMFRLESEYKNSQNLGIFNELITKSTGLNDQMTIFKIFKVMETSSFNETSYQSLFEIVNKTFKKKSDNMLLLLAQIKNKIAQNHKLNHNYQASIESLQQALDILEYSMVPPLFPYYSIYRQYGLLQHIIGQNQKAKEILTQTVEILHDFVSNSDDAVSTDQYCRKQATSYNCLARVDKENQKKWITKAEQAWKGFMGQKYHEVEYAKTVGLNFKKLLNEDKQKAEAYLHFNLYKFENKSLKELLKKAREETIP